MFIPKYDDMYRDVLDILEDGNAHDLKEIRNVLSKKLNISSDALKEKLPSGTPIFHNRVNWTCAYLKKAKLIKNISRGIYVITERGKSVIKENPNIIDNNYLTKFKDFDDFYSSKKKNENNKENNISKNEIIDNGLSPQDVIDDAFRKIKETLVDDILLEIMKQSPEFFEHLVVKLLTCMGYGSSFDGSAIVTKYSGDEGIDGIIREDKLGFDNVYIQAKRWDRSSSVGRPEIQKFVGALAGQGATKGLFITTAQFTKEAKEYVAKQHTTKTVLVDGNTLANLMIEYNVGVYIENTYSIKRIDSDFFDDFD